MKRMSPFPSIDEIISGDGDNANSFSLHRTLKSLLPQISYFLFSLAVLYIVEFSAAYIFGAHWRGKIPVVGGFSFRWFAIVPIGLLLEIVRRYNDDIYVFERDRIVHHAGLLSLTYNVPAIRYFDIRALQVNQGIIGRMLNYGDIELSTSAQDHSEVVLRGIHAPLALAAFIEEMRTWHHGGDGATYQPRRRQEDGFELERFPQLSSF